MCFECVCELSVGVGCIYIVYVVCVLSVGVRMLVHIWRSKVLGISPYFLPGLSQGISCYSLLNNKRGCELLVTLLSQPTVGKE